MTATTRSLARQERLALCDLFEEVGPEAPTLCEGWTTADLAAHLVVRERDPIGGAGIVVPQLASVTEQAMQKARERYGYEGLVRTLRDGPPPGPFRWFEGQLGLNEFAVHHEDVRRGDGTRGPRPESETADLDEALWDNLRRTAKLMTLRVRTIPLVIEWPGRAAHTIHRGREPVVLRARPTELTLYLNGRRQAAEVTVEGPEEARNELEAAHLGV